MNKKTTIILITILLVAFITRLVLAYTTNGDNYDIGSMIEKGQQIKAEGLTKAYDYETNYKRAVHYPPGWKYILGGLALLSETNILATHLKILAIISDLLTGLLIFYIISRKNKLKTALLASSFYLFNPSIIFISAVWTQWDALYTLLVLLSLFLITKDKPGISLVVLTLGLLLKMQTIIFFPLVIFLIYKKYKFKKLILSLVYAGSTFILISLPFILSGKVSRILEVTIEKGQTAYPYISASAFNIWWIPTLVKGRLNDYGLIFNLISYKLLGLILFSLSYLFILYFLHKKSDSASIWLATAFIALIFFMLPTEIHERYLFPFFALMSIIWLTRKKLWPLYIGLSLTFFINLVCFISPLAPPYELQNIQNFLISISEVMTVINIALFIYMVVILVYKLRQPQQTHV